MNTIVTKVDEAFVRLDETDDAGVCQASTSYKCDLDGDALLEWARAKTPNAASVEFAKPAAAAGKKSKTK